MIVSSYARDSDTCLMIPFIQEDNFPVVLSVNVTADPCPTAVWTKDGADLPEDAVSLCTNPSVLLHN